MIINIMGNNMGNEVSIVLIGDGAVGKTSLCERIRTDRHVYRFNKNYIASDGVNLHRVELKTNHGLIKSYLWDTAGQEKFGELRDGFVRPADVIILLYDVTESRTKDNVVKWLKYVNKNCNNLPPVIVCGNKIDKNKRANPFRLQTLKRYYQGPINSELISVKTGQNVNNIMSWILTKFYSETVRLS